MGLDPVAVAVCMGSNEIDGEHDLLQVCAAAQGCTGRWLRGSAGSRPHTW